MFSPISVFFHLVQGKAEGGGGPYRSAAASRSPAPPPPLFAWGGWSGERGRESGWIWGGEVQGGGSTARAVCIWDLRVSPHTRVCTRARCARTQRLYPLPGHPWGASRRGVGTAPTAGGVRGRPPPPRPQLRRWDTPPAGLPLRTGSRAARRGARGAPPSPPRVFVEGGTAFPSLRERRAKQPATGRGGRKKHPGGGNNALRVGGHFPGAFSPLKIPPPRLR